MSGIDEKKASSPTKVSPTTTKGALLLAGGTNWDQIGRKTSAKGDSTDYPTFSVFGPAAYIDVQQVISSCVSCHNVLIDAVSG